MKKSRLLFGLILVLFLFPKDIHALTSSDYSVRKTCSGKFELARANNDGSVSYVSCHNSYSEAKTAMNNSSYDDVFIFDEVSTTKIVDAKYALLDLSVNPETLTYFYETKDLNTRKYTGN